jgi:hypothetical protein
MDIINEYELLKEKIVERKKEAGEFLKFLETRTTWLTSPASTKYHLSEERGLLIHSVGVTKTCLLLRELLAPEIPEESCVITALFHDVGKIGMPWAPRYIKGETGYFYNTAQVEISIAARSLYLVATYIPLNEDEAQAILYHDGQYIEENRYVAHRETPLTLLLTFADTWTTAVNEEKRPVWRKRPLLRKEDTG